MEDNEYGQDYVSVKEYVENNDVDEILDEIGEREVVKHFGEDLLDNFTTYDIVNHFRPDELLDEIEVSAISDYICDTSKHSEKFYNKSSRKPTCFSRGMN